MNQKQRLRAVIDELYNNPANMDALARAESILDEARNGPPDGCADGSISERLWNSRSVIVKAFTTIQEARWLLDITEDE